jgi:hypothetical protein
MWNVTLYLKGYFNGKKRTTFQKYAETFKLKAVHLYKNVGRSYDAIAKELRMPRKENPFGFSFSFKFESLTSNLKYAVIIVII